MVPEIAAAVGFVSSLLRTRGCVSEQQLQVFSGALEEALTGENGACLLGGIFLPLGPISLARQRGVWSDFTFLSLSYGGLFCLLSAASSLFV